MWANCGAHQFHLAEGKPDPQVLDGCITLGYRSLDGVRERLAGGVPAALAASKFSATEMADGALALTDPWGSPFRLVEGVDDDARSRQENGEDAEARCILDLTLHLPSVTTPSRLAGLGRCYEQILGCEVTTSKSSAASLPPADRGVQTALRCRRSRTWSATART